MNKQEMINEIIKITESVVYSREFLEQEKTNTLSEILKAL